MYLPPRDRAMSGAVPMSPDAPPAMVSPDGQPAEMYMPPSEESATLIRAAKGGHGAARGLDGSKVVVVVFTTCF